MRAAFYREDVKLEPYWWEGCPHHMLPTIALPKRTDVAIVGGGYAGLSSALTLVKAGRSVIVFEAGLITAGPES